MYINSLHDAKFLWFCDQLYLGDYSKVIYGYALTFANKTNS
jgi:hypothetical protein